MFCHIPPAICLTFADERQRKNKPAALPILAGFDPDFPAMDFYSQAAKRQAEAKAPPVAPCSLHLSETLDDLLIAQDVRNGLARSPKRGPQAGNRCHDQHPDQADDDGSW